MTMLIAAAAAFLALHLIIAGTRLRDAITGAIGEGPYLGLFSLASLGGIVWLAIAYNEATAAGSAPLWDLGQGVSHLGIIVVGFAFLIAVSGLTTANPTALRHEGAAAAEPTGIGRASCRGRV